MKNNPKLAKLSEILNDHFKMKIDDLSTKAIVFTDRRNSVIEIVKELMNSKLLRPHRFIGQSKSSSSNTDGDKESAKGMKQEEQEEVIHNFRQGGYNVLVATCIGEEGLDIGEVDLIINFDYVNSPGRMIQRTGRTGRKREGKVINLVFEGAEIERKKKAKNNAKQVSFRR